MSLNSHVQQPSSPQFTLESLGLATKDDVAADGVLGTQAAEANASATVELPSGEDDPSETTLSQTEIEQLPKLDVSLKLIKDNAAKIVDMRDVQKDIEGTDVMSTQKGDVIEATFESFYSDSNPRVAFTSFESRTNLEASMRFMQSKLKVSMEALVTEFNMIKTDGLSKFSEDILRTREFCVNELTDKIVDSVRKIQAVIPRLLQGPVILPFSGDRFIDVSGENLLDLSISDLDQSVPVGDEFRCAFQKLQDLWRESDFITSVAQGFMDVYRTANPGVRTPEVTEGLFIATLIGIYGDHAPETCYDEFVSLIDSQTTSLKNKIEDIDIAISAGSDPAELIVSQSDTALRMAQGLTDMEKNVKDFACFTEAAAIVVVGLSALK